MTDYRYVNISLPNAKRLADLNGIAIDLRTCRDYCERYLRVFANILQPNEESKHLECISVYVFVKYGRCFKGGVRSKTAEGIMANQSPDDRKLHQLVLDIRDKYIAHSVNDLETHKVRVWLNPEEEGRRIDNVNVESQYLAGPEPQLFERLKELIDKHLSWIDREQRKEEEELTELVGNRFDLNDLYSLRAELPDRLDYSRVSQPRKTP
jgi:hypothetical protein